MNKHALAFAVFGVGLPAAALAQGTVTVYGRLDLSMDQRKSGSSTVHELVNAASRLGFKGQEDLGNGLKAVFGIEMGVNADDGTQTNPPYRNAFIGLTGPFGAAAIGRLDSANPTGSPLYSQITRNVVFAIHDAGATAIGTSILNARNRTSNAIGYRSPDYAGFSLRARFYMNGNNGALSETGPIKSEWDFRQTDMGLNYERGKLALGVGHGADHKSGGIPNNGFRDKWQLVGSYDFDVLKAYAAAGRDRFKGTASTRDSVSYALVGVSAPVGAHRITVNVMQRQVQADPLGKMNKWQAAYGYSLSKRSQLYAFIDRQDPNSNKANDTVRVWGLGMQHNF